MKKRGFIILDFGSQLTQLIARTLRELGHYSEVHPYHMNLAKIREENPYGIILSGGPHSVYEQQAPLRDDLKQLAEVAPLLGICYGMQLIAKVWGGEVRPAEHREYGPQTVLWNHSWLAMPREQNVWMSHGDVVEAVPANFQICARSETGHIAAMQAPRIRAMQFHPEVKHTEFGKELIQSFAQEFCAAPSDWHSPEMLKVLSDEVRAQVGDQDAVLCALSGGVDSSVVATLLTQALGRERVQCVFIDNGLLRKNEFASVLAGYQEMNLNVVGVDASQKFYAALKGKTDPEEKRKAIGRTFIEVFEQWSREEKKNFPYLAQGTLYPDVIESLSPTGGPSHVIKSHHNVGGLPEKMQMKLVEPVRWLFKDEVRALGRELGLQERFVGRHPFPGPGLAIRIVGEVNAEAIRKVQEADHIFIEALRKEALYDQIWQAFCVLLPVQTVGVQGDGRTFEQVLALRAVTSRDGMTADWFDFEPQFLRKVSTQITNQVKGISRVVYDITSKPPATIEWE